MSCCPIVPISCLRVVSMKILLDTNILMLPAQRRLDVFKEIERLLSGEKGEPSFFTLDSTAEELASKSKGRTKAAIAARVAQLILSQGYVKVLKAVVPKTDEAILHWANEQLSERTDFAVATNDVLLRRKLRKIGVRVICLKGGTKLDWC